MVWPEARLAKGEALARPARANKVAVKTGRLLASMMDEVVQVRRWRELSGRRPLACYICVFSVFSLAKHRS